MQLLWHVIYTYISFISFFNDFATSHHSATKFLWGIKSTFKAEFKKKDKLVSFDTYYRKTKIGPAHQKLDISRSIQAQILLGSTQH